MVNPGAIASNLGPVLGKSNCGVILLLEVKADPLLHSSPIPVSGRLGQISQKVLPNWSDITGTHVSLNCSGARQTMSSTEEQPSSKGAKCEHEEQPSSKGVN